MNRKQIGIAALLGVLAVSVIWYLAGSRTREQRNTSGSRSVIDTGAPLGAAQPATASQIIDLRDGESLDLAIMPVTKEIAGLTVDMLAYNGSIPGPTIRVVEGSEITVNLKNGGSIGTSLHAHGVRMENAFDGVPGVTQKEIAPGETFLYKLKFTDPGIFWYHPHVRTDYTLEAGLYANIIVTPKDSEYWPKVNREIPLMLDDIALDEQGMLPFDAKVADHTLMGRFGNVMLVNDEEKYRLNAKSGEVVRLYLTNAANTRLFNFTLPGVKMKLIGADLGRYAEESFVSEVLVAPGERRVVDVYFDVPGSYAMKHVTPERQYTIGQISVSSDVATPAYGAVFSELRKYADVKREMDALLSANLMKAPEKTLRISLDMNQEMRGGMPQGMHSMGHGGMVMSDQGMGMGDDGDALEWEDTMSGMNTQSNADMMKWQLIDDANGKTNMDINDWVFRVGENVKVRIFNDPQSMHPMQHPIHFHGQRFLVLSTNGVKNTNPVWLDTTLIAKGDTVDILLEVSNPGDWAVHCHILEHAESGMMFAFKVQ